MHSLDDNSTTIFLLPPTRYAGDPTTGYALFREGIYPGAAIDTKGEVGKIAAVVSIGATATVTIQIIIQESSDNSTWTTLQEHVESNTNCETAYDLTPAKRYIRGYAVLSGTNNIYAHSYVDASLVAIFYKERYYPNNTVAI